MFKKPTKKQFIIRRIILSTVATFAVIIIATAAILFMLGYRLDSGNGRLEQGALLQFDSTPNNAEVFIDGYDIGSRTATKHTVVAGVHTVTMTKDGYQDWNRTLDLSAGTLTWLDYVRLVPKELPVQSVAAFKAMSSMQLSPDSKWAIIQERADSPVLQLIDLRSVTVKQSSLTLPATSYAEAATPKVKHSFSVKSWDSGGRYVLITHLYKEQTEWLVLDTQNASQAINITRVFNAGLKDVAFVGTSGKVLYGLTNDGTVRKIDLAAGTLSRAFVTHVESFSLFDDKILSYVGTDPSNATKRVAGVYRDGDEAPHILRSISGGETVLKVAASRYFSDDLVAIAEGNVVTILRGKYPSSSAQDATSLAEFATFELSGAVSMLSFSPDGDFVVAQSGESFQSYEIEHKRTEPGVIATKTSKAVSALRWLDAAHLWNDDGGTLVMRDFNGANVFPVMKVAPGFGAGLSQNGRFFYAIGATDNGYQLQRVTMILG